MQWVFVEKELNVSAVHVLDNYKMCQFQSKQGSEVWKCPFENYTEGLNHCIFHLPEEKRTRVPENQFTERFKETVENNDSSELKILGAKIPKLNLEYFTVGSGKEHPINMRYAEIGELVINKARVNRHIFLEHSKIGILNGSGAMLKSDLLLTDSEINKLDFEQIESEGAIWANDSVVKGECNLDSANLDTVNFSNTEFNGEVNFRSSHLNEGIFRECEFLDSVSFRSTEFDRAAVFFSAEFKEAEFYSCSFGREAYFTTAVFSEDTNFHAAEFEIGVFPGSFFKSSCSFASAEFNTAAIFEPHEGTPTKVEGDLAFNGTTFSGDIRFNEVEATGSVIIRDSNFDDNAIFQGSKWDDLAFDQSTIHSADFTDCNFAGLSFQGNSITNSVSFVNSTFKDAIYFTGTDFGKDVAFNRAQFEDSVSFQQCTFGTAHFHEVRFDENSFFQSIRADEIHFAPNVFNFEVLFNFSDASLGGGYLHRKKGHLPFYDLSAATIGNVSLLTDADENIFEFIHFEQTDFDGFDFSNYEEELVENGWVIHDLLVGEQKYQHMYQKSRDIAVGVKPPGAEQDDNGSIDSSDESTSIEDISSLENTYTKAKNCANNRGNSKIAQKFFIREMKTRRNRYKEVLFNNEEGLSRRYKSAIRVFLNWFFYRTCGYGEKPSWTVLSSIITIVGFSAVYWLAGLTMPYPGPSEIEISLSGTSMNISWVGYLIFSIEAFTTLVFPGGADITSWMIRLLSAIEGFIGAFLIALFVYTLTRTIDI